MAELLGYSIVNGRAKNYEFNAEVKTQEDIDSYRDKLMKRHRLKKKNDKIVANNKLTGGNDDLYNIYFTVRQEQGGRLTP